MTTKSTKHTTPTDLVNCARCGEDHDQIILEPLTRPASRFGATPLTHWALCPTTGEPILARWAVTE